MTDVRDFTVLLFVETSSEVTAEKLVSTTKDVEEVEEIPKTAVVVEEVADEEETVVVPDDESNEKTTNGCGSAEKDPETVEEETEVVGESGKSNQTRVCGKQLSYNNFHL